MSRTIGLNTLFLIPNSVGGTENYTRVWIDALQEADTQNTYIVFCNEENFDSFTFSNPCFHKVKCPIFASNRVARILYEQIVLPFVIAKNKCDVIHSFGYTGPAFCRAKKVVTIHDANWKDHPEDMTTVSWMILTSLMALVIATTDVIVTDSNFARLRLTHFYPKLKEKIQVILPWVGEKLITEFQKRHAHPMHNKPYILCVSGLYPHKQIPYLLSIIGTYELVLIGKNGLDEAKVSQRVNGLPNVQYFQKVSLEELAAYYQHASLFIFPSVYEGFGYPVYEAAAVGLPILVGKKDLYESEIQSKVRELQFQPIKDKKSIAKMMSSNESRRPAIFKKDQSVKKLVSLYSSL